MNPFFCAEASSEAGEDLIGSAPPCQTYILIECPLPWTPNAFESKLIPQNLRDRIESVRQSRLPIRFLLVARSENSACPPVLRPQILIYEQQLGNFCQGYRCREHTVDHLDQVAPLIQRYLAGQLTLSASLNRDRRDLLVCVHGSHDKCCAKYGLPFYREAIATVAQLGYSNVHLWKTSHFGGHRFAPTLIDLPEGRYYGRLNQSALRSILMRSGDLQSLNLVYRGWSILPQWLQPLENELIQHHGWQWFDYKISHRLLKKSANGEIQAELWVEQPDGLLYHYEVEMIRDLEKTICLKSSCDSNQALEPVIYRVKSLQCRQSSLAIDNSLSSRN
ncbi:MAG: sucrase ferredoxin [Timaviella obliquedivisa GSE-PSE-MK23-08B]|jgi:hypothetical protein|nr:sucrase ferredoxin [Timaviella obliquedivisa GSE-PSE-MK23-08B]